MSGALVEIERDGAIARLWLARPEARNALSAALLDELALALGALAGDGAVRVVVLGGRGPDFCAGADLQEMRRHGQASASENLAGAQRLGALFAALDDFPLPVVGRVHGSALGGGSGLVAACDFAVAASSARFGFSEVRLGLVPAVIAPYVVRRIGTANARELFLTGERLDGERAARIGLVQQAVPPEELDAAVAAKVALLLEGSPAAQAAIKRLIRMAGELPMAEARERTPPFIAEARASPDGQEGLAAFLEKRKPRWQRGG